MKKLILIFIGFIIVSCVNEEYEYKYQEAVYLNKTKEIQLDYLNKLYLYKNKAEIEKYILILDSLILIEETKLYKNNEY